MGSGAETAEETAEYLNEQGEKVGVVTVHLFRPFSVEHFVKALPATVKTIAVLDRTKEPGAAGEPLYQDVVTAIIEGLTQRDCPLQDQSRASSAGATGCPPRNSPRPWSRPSSMS